MKIEEICKKFKISKQTWYNWQKTKPELVELIIKGLESEKNGGITINGHYNNITGNHNKIIINGNDICKEICEAVEKLTEQKQKKFYHKIMLEIFEELEND